MISIRLRILLLAFVSLTAVSLAFYVEYLDIKKRLNYTEHTQHISQDLLLLSNLIHPLQKERGLTATYLYHPTTTLHKQLKAERNKTNTLWLKTLKLDHLHDSHLINDFPLLLRTIRQRVDQDTVNWADVNLSYSDIIQKISDLMLIKIGSMDYSQDISYELQLLSYLTLIRENLGIVRDTIYQSFQQNKLTVADVASVQEQINQLNHHLRVYNLIAKAHIQHEENLSWLLQFENKSFEMVMYHINYMLKQGSLSQDLPANSWWLESTSVIDSMKQIEDIIFDDMGEHIEEHLNHDQNYLFWYGLLASIVLISTLILTVFIVFRIIKALSILIHSLKKVETEQNFAVRINSQSSDEFGQLSLSINSLLSYTDNLIKEKDFFAKTDMLTGVMNRRSFINSAEKEQLRSTRYQQNLSLIYCDIDFFKQVNDKFGHAIGDNTLKLFSTLLEMNLRKTDYLGRWGGEEFIILVPEADLEFAHQLAEKLRVVLMSSSFAPVEQLTASFGVAQYHDGDTLDSVCERADKALYLAKNQGRNRVCIDPTQSNHYQTIENEQ